MNFVISTAIGGEVTNEPDTNLRSIIINMAKRLKNGFENVDFVGLNKISINLYISGDISEYCNFPGISKVRYIKKKKEISVEFCIQRTYWETLTEMSLEEKFWQFISSSLFDLEIEIDKKLKINDFPFEKEKFNAIVEECFN